nr:Rac-like GTP-binding protein RAC2 [Tanacetum cinerariifolium]
MENIKVALMKHATNAMKESRGHDFLASDYVPTVFDNFSATVVVGESTVNLGLWVLLSVRAAKPMLHIVIHKLQLLHNRVQALSLIILWENSSAHQVAKRQIKWQKEESCLDAATVVNKEAAAHGQKEESCLDVATVVNKEAAAHGQKEESCLDVATVVNKEAVARDVEINQSLNLAADCRHIMIVGRSNTYRYKEEKNLYQVVSDWLVCLGWERIFIRCGADVNAVDLTGQTALRWSVSFSTPSLPPSPQAKLLQGMKLPECPHEGCKYRLDIKSSMEFLTPKSYEIMILWEKKLLFLQQNNVGVNHSLHRLFALSTSVHSERQKEERCLDAAIVVNKEVVAHEVVETSMVATSKEPEQQEYQDALNEISEEKDDAKSPISADTFGINGGNDLETTGPDAPVKEVLDNGIESEVVVGLPGKFQEGDMVDALLRVSRKVREIGRS